MTIHIYSKRKSIAFCNYVYIFFLVWIFVQAILIKTTLSKITKKEFEKWRPIRASVGGVGGVLAWVTC